jgi:hydrogenase nickel incorporation protein HypA/HybF
VHELGLCSDVVAAVERRAGERPVARVRVRVGRLHHVHPEAFEQSFALAAAGGVAAGAVAELVVVPVTARCPACGGSAESQEPIPACPYCGAVGVELTGGDELILEEIEYRGQPQEV